MPEGANQSQAATGEPTPRAVTRSRETQLAEFLYLIAHDIRQPLASAQMQVWALRIALERGDLARAGASVGGIVDALAQIEAMTRDLVDSARLELGQVQPSLNRIALSQFVEEFVASRTLSLDDGHRLRFGASEPATVSVDPFHLERILDNLLSNARKYSPPHTPITLSVARRAAEAVVAVRDEGIGIPPEDADRVFERGYRRLQTAQQVDGLGLGLYITRLLAEAQSGRVWFESEPGKGSTFYVGLPLLAEAD